MPGGIQSAADAGLAIEGRDEIYKRIQALPEGAVFEARDIVEEGSALAASFSRLRGHDYIHLCDGLMTGIVETTYLRRLPRAPKVLESLCERFGQFAIEAGEWDAWRLGFMPHEPWTGRRYYTEGETRAVAFGQAGMRFVHAPAWLLQTSRAGQVIRIIADAPERERERILSDVAQRSDFGKEVIQEAYAMLLAIPEADQTDQPHSPAEILKWLEDALAPSEAGAPGHGSINDL